MSYPAQQGGNRWMGNKAQNYNAYFVTKMKIFPLSLPNFSLADSLAEVEQAGYSPPTPIPVNPLETVSIQNMPPGAI